MAKGGYYHNLWMRQFEEDTVNSVFNSDTIKKEEEE